MWYFISVKVPVFIIITEIKCKRITISLLKFTWINIRQSNHRKIMHSANGWDDIHVSCEHTNGRIRDCSSTTKNVLYACALVVLPRMTVLIIAKELASINKPFQGSVTSYNDNRWTNTHSQCLLHLKICDHIMKKVFSKQSIWEQTLLNILLYMYNVVKLRR